MAIQGKSMLNLSQFLREKLSANSHQNSDKTSRKKLSTTNSSGISRQNSSANSQKNSNKISRQNSNTNLSANSSKMPLRVFILAALLLCGIIVLANYTVQFQILGSPLTFGALTYPFSFLVLDILSEKYSKKETIRVLGAALILAFYPSYLSATPQIALASIAAFCISQPLDVVLFYTFKRLAPKFWWLRGTSSTLIAQFFDTLIFFAIAFWGVQTLTQSLTMAVADYSIKALVGFVNIPLFYVFAIAPLRKVAFQSNCK